MLCSVPGGRAEVSRLGLNPCSCPGRPRSRFPLHRKAREKMMDSSRTVGNGFTYQEKLSSSKLTSVLEAVAGEYALVINGHSLVSVVILRLGSIFSESGS